VIRCAGQFATGLSFSLSYLFIYLFFLQCATKASTLREPITLCDVALTSLKLPQWFIISLSNETLLNKYVLSMCHSRNRYTQGNTWKTHTFNFDYLFLTIVWRDPSHLQCIVSSVHPVDNDKIHCVKSKQIEHRNDDLANLNPTFLIQCFSNNCRTGEKQLHELSN
jgi:hypothetical protein